MPLGLFPELQLGTAPVGFLAKAPGQGSAARLRAVTGCAFHGWNIVSVSGRGACLLALGAHIDHYQRRAGSGSIITEAADTLSQEITFQLMTPSFVSTVHLR